MNRRLWLRLRQDRLALACLCLLALILAAGLLAPWIAPHDPLLVSWRDKYHGISLRYPLGADHLGRCVFSRLLYGIRTTVLVSLSAMAATLAIGLLIGMLAGYFRGRVDALLMRLCDVMLSFPGEVMIFALVGMMGPGLQNIILAVLLVKWAWYARMIRGIVLQYSDRHYVQFARVIGGPARYIIRRHLLPVTAAEIAVLATTDSGAVILLLSALSFIGLGVQPPAPEWGAMLGEAKNLMLTHPEQMLPAGLAIMLVVAAFNYLGDFLRDVLDKQGPD
ncbi:MULTISPECIES: nickel/cobalt ABC transporter permease [Brenneria]|uniref:ABC transporter permease subunit n=1 Tax=Brenneria nigrifluens DSM 30175 = ATCC 13028 TaxID=1121120 RepID=A0A2U1UTK6_9GAMM|nr:MULTISPECIES: nickel/cobalt ABC transporter permease [Brenneria]EHD19764.1 ABC-type transporter, integral membrane subunit [Brenneria sp. EniD312]PWC24977.1 nickel ABC transporter permease subunit NikC [Brenneria nigrifluens DSM 30175 = ATCC 13028]QCR03025.1 ABC transporter permease subunit [Brenneria nigrifluens DSM 30175 = ATCC 13028]